MEYQKPAAGIMLSHNYRNSKSFTIECDCATPEHAIHSWIEVLPDKPAHYVQISFFVNTRVPAWHLNLVERFKLAWKILINGRTCQESELILNKQSAFNFANAILETIKELESNKSENSNS